MIFGGGDGWLYAFEATTGNLLWKFDCNPKDAVWLSSESGTRNYIVATPVIVDGRVLRRAGKFMAFDHARIVAEAREAAMALRARAGWPA